MLASKMLVVDLVSVTSRGVIYGITLAQTALKLGSAKRISFIVI